MEQREPGRTVVLGIDPGRNTGLYSVEIPRLNRAMTLDEFQRDARWLGNAAVSLSSSEALKPIEKWAALAQALRGAMMNVQPNLVVLEYPADRLQSWTGGSAQGTEFHMGMFFGFAALAAQEYGGHRSVPIALMPVTSSKKRAREGWMPRVTERSRNGKRMVTHVQDQETTLRQCGEIAKALYRNTGASEREYFDHMYALSKHERMALGVLTFYITHRSPSEWGK